MAQLFQIQITVADTVMRPPQRRAQYDDDFVVERRVVDVELECQVVLAAAFVVFPIMGIRIGALAGPRVLLNAR